MPFVNRTDEEIILAMDWWFINHPHPDQPFKTEDEDKEVTPRVTYKELRDNSLLLKQFCNTLRFGCLIAGKDPVEVLKNAPYK